MKRLYELRGDQESSLDNVRRLLMQVVVRQTMALFREVAGGLAKTNSRGWKNQPPAPLQFSSVSVPTKLLFFPATVSHTQWDLYSLIVLVARWANTPRVTIQPSEALALTHLFVACAPLPTLRRSALSSRVTK